MDFYDVLGTPIVMQFLTAITSWSPTIVLFIMFQKLYPNSSIKEFYIKCFKEKLNIRLLLMTFITQLFSEDNRQHIQRKDIM